MADVVDVLIIHMVTHGKRLPLDAITGPADLVSFATRWIPLCWDQSPDQQPSFDGKHCSGYPLVLESP